MKNTIWAIVYDEKKGILPMLFTSRKAARDMNSVKKVQGVVRKVKITVVK